MAELKSSASIVQEPIASGGSQTVRLVARGVAFVSLTLIVAAIALMVAGSANLPDVLCTVALLITGMPIAFGTTGLLSPSRIDLGEGGFARAAQAGWTGAGSAAVVGSALIALSGRFGGWQPQAQDDWFVITMVLLGVANSMTLLHATANRQGRQSEIACHG